MHTYEFILHEFPVDRKLIASHDGVDELHDVTLVLR